jgi:SAM-dependent methyltransferase
VTSDADKPELERIARDTLAHYEERADAFWEGTRDHDVSQNVAALLEHIRGEPPFTILDFGCGPGETSRPSPRSATRRSGSKARRRSPRWRARTAAARCGSRISEARPAAGRFDGVFANASLFHVPRSELPRVLRELHAALATDGILFSSNPHGSNEEGWNRGRFGSYHDPRAWRRYGEQAGFHRARVVLSASGSAARAATVARNGVAKNLSSTIRCPIAR